MKKQFSTILVTTFTLSTLAISILGIFIGDIAAPYSTLFLKEGGLSYFTILQILLISAVNSFLVFLIMDGKPFKKRSLFFRLCILYLSLFLATSGLCSLFQWFPSDDWIAWVSFFLCYNLCMIGSTVIQEIKFRIMGQTYDSLLYQYKKEHENKAENENR